MPKKQQLLEEVGGETGYGILLMTQMDGVPDTLQLVVTTAEYDAEVDGLREKKHYVVRALGVREHRVSVGVFKTLEIHEGDSHPLLYTYNTPSLGVFFRGQPQHPEELVLDIFQGYASTFGPWRHIPQFINTNMPLLDLVKSGGHMLGEMPQPLAQRMEKVLQHHALETKLIEAQHEDDHKPPPPAKVLLIDEGYVVAFDFSVDELGKV